MSVEEAAARGLVELLTQYHLLEWMVLGVLGLIWKVGRSRVGDFESRLAALEAAVRNAATPEQVHSVQEVIKGHVAEEKDFWREVREELKEFRASFMEFGERISLLEGTLRRNGGPGGYR